MKLRNLKTLIIIFVINLILIGIMNVFFYKIAGMNNRPIEDVLFTQLPFFFLLPLNFLIQGRIVEKTFSKDEFNWDKFDAELKKFRSKTISTSEEISIYQMSKFYSFDGRIVLKQKDEAVFLQGPIGLIREL